MILSIYDVICAHSLSIKSHYNQFLIRQGIYTSEIKAEIENQYHEIILSEVTSCCQTHSGRKWQSHSNGQNQRPKNHEKNELRLRVERYQSMESGFKDTLRSFLETSL